MTLPIAQLGQPVLRKVAAAVPADEIPRPEFQKFLDDMYETLRAPTAPPWPPPARARTRPG